MGTPTHAFWTIRPRAVDAEGVNYADLPAVPAGAWYKTTVPGDVNIATEGAAPGDHRHLVVGGVGVPSNQQPDHYHWFVRHNGGVAQVTVGGTPHTHTGDLLPDFYLLFIVCDDAAWAAFDAGGVVKYAEAPVSALADGFQITDLDNTPWTTAQRNAMQTRLTNVVNLSLPDEVTNGRRFIAWLLSMTLARPMADEKPYRYTSA